MRRRLATPAGRFAVACAAGGVLALVVLAWFATTRQGVFGSVQLGDFYETQARSWLHGRWDAAPNAYLFERFAVGGKYYTYFGPWPALLRLPFVAVTDSLDGKLSAVSVVLACSVLLVGVAGLSWEARRAWRGDAMPTVREQLLAGGLVLLAGVGTTLVFLAGWTAVYHEAILWGVAWAVVSFWLLIRHLRAGRPLDLVLASVAAASSLLSRGSVGLGPIVAIGLVAAARGVDFVRRRGGLSAVVGPGLAALVPFALYGMVNAIKFGSAFGLPPYEKQDIILRDFAPRLAAMKANGGSLFGLQYAPTILLHYFRPDGIRFTGLFPFVNFPPTAHVVGDAVFESRNPTASLTATSPILVLLAVGGVVALIRVRRSRVFLAPVVGALVGAVGAFSLAFVDERYLGDFIPLLVVAGVLGAWWLAAAVSRARPWTRVVVIGVFAMLAAWSMWSNSALSYVYMYSYRPILSIEDRGKLVSTQLRVHDLLGGGPLPDVVHVDHLPITRTEAAGTLAVLGDCDGLYWTDGRAWEVVEQTTASGLIRARLQLDPLPASATGTREPVFAATNGDVTTVLWAVRDGNSARLDLTWFDAGGEHRITGAGAADAARTRIPVGKPVDVELQTLGSNPPIATVKIDGKTVIQGEGPVAGVEPIFGSQPDASLGGTSLHGTVTPDARPSTPLCGRIVRAGS